MKFKKWFFLIAILSGNILFGQERECKVLIEDISEKYSGRCRRGLAHGSGIAEGIDRYEGRFRRGLPHGQGTYTWADGSYYEGQWNEGRREGKGVLVSGEKVLSGYWKDDEYLGEELVLPYKVIRSISVSRYTVTKNSDTGNSVRVRFMQAGSHNDSIEDLLLGYDSGSQFFSGPVTGLENVVFPVDVRITYRSWNQLRTSQFNVTFEISVNDPGTWEIILFN